MLLFAGRPCVRVDYDVFLRAKDALKFVQVPVLWVEVKLPNYEVFELARWPPVILYFF